MESTQDIVQSYLGLPERDVASDFDLDSLADPLDDLDLPPLPSPPTSYASPPPRKHALLPPLKHASPPPTSYASPPLRKHAPPPRSPVFAASVDADMSEYGSLVPDATHWRVEASAVPTSKEFERYLALLASATDKLVRQLDAERARSRALQAQVASLGADRDAAAAARAQVALLRRRAAELESRAEHAERASRAHSAVVRENTLLREKLAKYKALHDAARPRPQTAPLATRDAVAASGAGSADPSAVADLVALLRRLEPSIHAQLHPPAMLPPGPTYPGHVQAPGVAAAAPDLAAAVLGTAAAQPPQDPLLALTGHVARIGSEMHKVNENLTCRCRAKQPCSACLSAGVDGAPHSSPQGHTEALMGKYAWNRTV